jgi:ferredoxin-NADP reductase
MLAHPVMRQYTLLAHPVMRQYTLLAHPVMRQYTLLAHPVMRQYGINTLRGQNVEFLSVIPGGKYSNHFVLKS